MSLTAYVSQKVVRRKIRLAYDRPNATELGTPIVPQHIGTDPRLVGTAFDYLLRFFVERLNPGAVFQTWLAETVVLAIEQALANGRPARVQRGVCPSPTAYGKTVAVYGKDNDPETTARRLRLELNLAKTEWQSYVRGRELSRELLRSCCILAKLDWVSRSSEGQCLPSEWDSCQPSNLDELAQLHDAIDPAVFIATKRCILNPRFRTNLIEADADLMIDDRIIECKVVSRPRLDQRNWDQLMGYYAIYRDGGFIGIPRNVRVRQLGIYSARFSAYQAIDLVERQLERAERLSEWMLNRLRRDCVRFEAIKQKWLDSQARKQFEIITSTGRDIAPV